jgi:phenylpyruvate tautomerase PptA (4-oxalocrotonate tautomerase family)
MAMQVIIISIEAENILWHVYTIINTGGSNMPYVQVNLSQNLSDDERKSVSDLINSKITLIPGKIPDVTMVNVNDGCSMRMGYSADPVIFVDVKLFKQAPHEAKNDFVREVTENLATMFGVNPKYIYFNMNEYDNWGSNGVFR